MSANPSIWSNVQIKMQSVLAASKTITAVTKANPGVASATAHGYSDGDYVLITAQGMTQIDGRIFRVAGSAANAFNLEGEDTTLYDTFTSGGAQKITFGTSLATATNLTPSGGEYEYIDVTTIHDSVRRQIPGLAAASNYQFENIWDVADAGLIALKLASDQRAQRCFEFIFSNLQKVFFNGYVGATLLPGGAAQALVTTPVTVTMFGRPTVYSS